MNTLMRKTLGKTSLLASVATACVLLSAAVPAQQASQEQALRELNIMRNIFDAVMEDRNRQFRINGPDALYLAGQGMVFTFNMSNGNFFTMPNINIYNGGDFDFDFDFDYDDDNDDNSNTDSNATALTYVREQQAKMQEFQEQMRAKQQEMQDKQETMRDLQREMRDLQREQRQQSASVDDAQLDKINEQMEALGKEMETIGRSINDQQQNYRKEQNAVAETLFAQQTDLIFSTLCSYGTTLKSLGNGEHVNLVMENHNNGESKIYVIDYAKLANCSSGDQLRQSAVSYGTNSRGRGF